MPGKPTSKNALIRGLVKQFPTLSKKGLAELAVEKYPTWFNYEGARTLIRTVTGSQGAAARRYTQNIIQKPKYELPPSRCKEREFVKLPLIANNILWLSDIHLPNHDSAAIEAAIEYGRKQKVNCVVLGGDILDNAPFTSHDGPPPGLDDVRTWFEQAEQLLAYIRHKFPKAHIVWIEGNHDNWMMRYLMKKAPMLFNDEYYHLPQRLNLKKYNIDFYKEHVILLAGRLQLHHGHTMIRGVFAPVNAARGLFLRTKSNAMIGHVHTTSQHSEKDLKGSIIGTWSVGCLCTLAPDYDPHGTKHNHGFAHIIVEKGGDFKVNNLAIHKGRII